MRNGARQLAAIFVVLAILIPSCERASKTPPPEDVLRVMNNIKAAFNAEDTDAFTADFAAIMFTQGFTKDAYLDVIQQLKRKYGHWETETYLGEVTGEYAWRLKMEKGSLKLILVLNEEHKVIGLWFRRFALWEKVGGK